MLMSNLARIAALGTALIALNLLAACDEEPSSAQTPKQKPVSVVTLEERDFSRETRLTGSISPYREEKIGFEVAGRVLSVMDLGREVFGPAYDDTGGLVRVGEIIARLDDTRFRHKVRALEARKRATEKELEAQQIEADQVAEANLKAARARLKIARNETTATERDVEAADAELTAARTDLTRQKELLKTVSGRKKAVDDATARFDIAQARVAQSNANLEARRSAFEAQNAVVEIARANIKLKQAQVESTLARITEIEEELRQAQEDMADCNLTAPYSGRITSIHTSQGAVVAAGTPIVTLSLMDPIQVRVEVSADDERRIQTGNRVLLYPKDPIDPDGAPVEVIGFVYEKGAVANLDTRTFRIDIMARNERRRIEQLSPDTEGLPLVTDYLPAVKRYHGETGDLFVHVDAVLRDGGKTYVLRLPGVGFNKSGPGSVVGRHVPQKVEVTLGGDYLTVINWNFRSLLDAGSLEEGDFLVIGPDTSHLAGVAIGRPQWLLRPGDLLPVRFALRSTGKGFYVPVTAITTHGADQVVFAVEDGMARRKVVTAHDTYEELRRIEGAGIGPGARIVVGGVHYIADGQPVSVVHQETLTR